MNEVMRKTSFRMTPRFLAWVTNAGNLQTDSEQGEVVSSFFLGELKLRFLRNLAGDAGQLFRVEL